MFEDRRGWLGMGKGAVREYPRTGGASSEVAKRAQSAAASSRRPARGQPGGGGQLAASSRPARGRRPGGAKIFLDKSFCLCQDFFMKFVFFIFSRGLSWFFKFSPTCPVLPLGCLDSSLICVDGPWLKCEKKFSSVQEGLWQ